MSERLLAARYRLEQNLDAEGATEVWRAVDVRRHRIVTVHLPKTPGSAAIAAVFAAEMEASKRFRHRSLVRRLDVGRDGDLDYLVSEFAAGETLAELAGGAGLGERTAPAIAELCRLVAAARRAGVSHVALEPRHLVIGPAGVKVTRFHDHGDGPLSLRTSRFTAPEQATIAVATEAQDVYNLGAILGAATAQPGGEDHDALVEVARKATSRDPAQRYTTVAAMLDTVRACRERGGIQRHVRPVVALAAVGIAVGILATWFLGARVPVPSVVGMRVPAASAAIRRANLVPDPPHAAGALVRSQQPAPGTRVTPRTVVHLLPDVSPR